MLPLRRTALLRRCFLSLHPSSLLCVSPPLFHPLAVSCASFSSSLSSWRQSPPSSSNSTDSTTVQTVQQKAQTSRNEMVPHFRPSLLDQQSSSSSSSDSSSSTSSLDINSVHSLLPQNTTFPSSASLVSSLKHDELKKAKSSGVGGVGGRKTSRAFARLKIVDHSGAVYVNHLYYTEYFRRFEDRLHVMMPLLVTRTMGQFDVNVQVQGGGKSGQAGAVRHAIADALNSLSRATFRPVLKKLKLLSRDPRMVERKHTGKKKARRAHQWQRR